MLAERRDAKANEPYIWREAGTGRVFYAAWGHDHRTWSNLQLVALIERGIGWAVGEKQNPSAKPGRLSGTRNQNISNACAMNADC